MAYDQTFYSSQSDSSYLSASVIVPKIIELLQVTSVVDVGCGVGTWLRAFEEHAITDVYGIDGDYVNIHQLQISQGKFLAHDLVKPIRLDRKFDCCLSLEVAEHLPSQSATEFVASLTTLSDVVVFSAAIPNQGGVCHINEQWQSHWIELFHECGYEPYCDIRTLFWNDKRISDWYRQNLFVFVNTDRYKSISYVAMANVVHPDTFERVLKQSESNLPNVPVAFRSFVASVGRSLNHRLGRQ